jgi:DNA polymerase III subunit epsilon
MATHSFVALDFETTGLSHRRGDRVIEVAAIRFAGNRIVDKFVTLVDPGVRVPGMVTALTGITSAMLRGAPSPCEVMPALARFVGRDIVVAHNASFDHGFLLAECSHEGVRWQPTGVACTMKLSRRLLGGLASFKLQSVADHLGVRFDSRAHRAEADALVVARIVPKLEAILADDYGHRLAEPKLFVDIGSWPISSVRRRLESKDGWS